MSNGQEPDFVGESDANFGHALHEAATQAQNSLTPEELHELPWFTVVSTEIQIGNPHITAYRVGISRGGGG